jgi:hypothetical protein
VEHEIVVALLVVGGMLRDERERAPGLKAAVLHVGERLETLPPRGSFELGQGDELALEMGTHHATISNEHVGLAFDLVELPPVKQQANERTVQDQ